MALNFYWAWGDWGTEKEAAILVKQYILFDMFAFIFFVRGLDVVERENVFVS